MRKIKSFLCFLTLLLSLFTLSACSISEISIEDAYTDYVQKVNVDSLRRKEYLEAEITDIIAEKIENEESENLFKLTTYTISVNIQPNKFYVRVKNSNEDTVEEYLFKHETDSYYLYYRKNNAGVASEQIEKGRFDECKNMILDIMYPADKILPKSIECIEATEVFISGLTSVKVIYTNELNEACSVSISESKQIGEFILVSADNTYSTVIKYVYPYNWNYTDIPSLV